MTPTPLHDPEEGPFVAQGGAVLAAGRARGLPPEVVASPARVSVLGLPRPVKGSLRRALPALDRTRQPEWRGVGRSDSLSRGGRACGSEASKYSSETINCSYVF